MGNYPLIPLPALPWLGRVVVAAGVAVGWLIALVIAGAVALVALVVALAESALRWVAGSFHGAFTEEEAQPVTAVLLLMLAIMALRAASGQ